MPERVNSASLKSKIVGTNFQLMYWKERDVWWVVSARSEHAELVEGDRILILYNNAIVSGVVTNISERGLRVDTAWYSISNICMVAVLDEDSELFGI